MYCEADGTITTDTLKSWTTNDLEKERKALCEAIDVFECFGVRDLQLESMITRELGRREETEGESIEW